jgi:DNA-binding PadR family transcriptional regulator
MFNKHRHGQGFGRRFTRQNRDSDEGFAKPRSHRRGGHGGHGLGRFFAHGDLRLVILHLIAEKPRHGYDIIKAIEDGVAGAYSPSPGVIYPTLTLLEELGYVTAKTEGAKKLHEITPEGRLFLDANRSALDALLSRMGEAGAVRGSGRSPAIVRAMENLKVALRLRMARGSIEDEQIDRIAAAIDEAAARVEKI